MTKFLSRNNYSPEIKEVEVDRANETSVWIAGRVHRRKTDYESYHETFELAKLHLAAAAETDISAAKHRLGLMERKLERIQALKATV